MALFRSPTGAKTGAPLDHASIALGESAGHKLYTVSGPPYGAELTYRIGARAANAASASCAGVCPVSLLIVSSTPPMRARSTSSGMPVKREALFSPCAIHSQPSSLPAAMIDLDLPGPHERHRPSGRHAASVGPS